MENIPGIGDVTLDTFYKKKVFVRQRKKGYRFSLDAPILADFLPPMPQAEAVEIGTGSGIISLLALYKNKLSKLSGVEIQTKLSRLAQLNAQTNCLSHRFNVINADFKEIYKEFSGINLIFSNPPYMPVGIGRLSQNSEVRKAKFEITITLKDVIGMSYQILGNKGCLYLIMPYNRYQEVVNIAKETGFYISALKEIFSFSYGKPERFLIKLTNYQDSVKNLKPLIVFKQQGVYTEDMEKIFAGS